MLGALSIHHSVLVIYHNKRIVVPKNARSFIICQIHKSHSGISKSLWRFRRDYWWFNYSRDIEKHVKACSECIKFQPLQRMDPLINQNNATEPMTWTCLSQIIETFWSWWTCLVAFHLCRSFTTLHQQPSKMP